MQASQRPFRIIAMLVFGALTAAPFTVMGEDAPVPETAAEAEPAPEAPAEDDEAKARLREQLESREAERAQLRQQNCDRARGQLEQVVNMPPRNVRRTLEDGTISRMTEEEHQAYIEELRRVEAENCG